MIAAETFAGPCSYRERIGLVAVAIVRYYDDDPWPQEETTVACFVGARIIGSNWK